MNHIKHFFDNFISNKKAPKGKKIAFIIALSLIFVAPTALAAGYVIYHEIAKPDDYLSVTLYDSHGDLIASEKRNLSDMSGSSLAETFYHLTMEENQSIETPHITSGQPYVRAEIDSNGTELDLLCYFSTDNEDGGFYIDSQNKCYSISKKLNAEFLSTSYAEVFYSDASIFQLTTADLDVITPKSVDWSYKAVDGQYLKAIRNDSSEDIKTYEITSAIDITFENAPDVATAHVYSNDKLIFSGGTEALSSLPVESSDIIRVYIEAQWTEETDLTYYGTVIYEFYVHLKNRSSFSISSDTVNAGGFIILNCYNVTDAKKISFSSSRQGFSPVFVPYGDYWTTIIPFPQASQENLLDMTVTYGATSENFSVTVLPPTEKNNYLCQSFNTDISYEPDDIRHAILSTEFHENPLAYFRGNFDDPLNGDYDLLYSHGSTIIYGDKAEDQAAAAGSRYILKNEGISGGSVRAVQGGIVAYAGYSDLLGHFTVIDHGCGLRTWYTGLGNIDVKVGDILLTDQHLGKTSASTLDGTEGFTLFCTVNDVIIDPDTLWAIKY